MPFYCAHTGTAQFIDVNDVSLSDFDYGDEVEVLCSVETCISDMVMQLFREDQLIDMVTVEEGNRFVGYAKIKATAEMLGSYVCQGMSEEYNKVFQQSFSVTGM